MILNSVNWRENYIVVVDSVRCAVYVITVGSHFKVGKYNTYI